MAMFTHTKMRPMMIDPSGADIGLAVGLEEEAVDGGDRHAGERAADPDRVRGPVQDRGGLAGELAVGHAGPGGRCRLRGERGAQLGDHEAIRQQEQEDEDDEPDESLAEAPLGQACDWRRDR